MKVLICIAFLIATCKCGLDINSQSRNYNTELLYFTQLETEGHVVLSPFGIWTLMNGVALGASGESYNQLQRAFLLPDNQVTLINQYKNRTRQVLDSATNGVTISSKNFMFLDQRFSVDDDFKNMIQKDFGAIKVLKFADAATASRIANKYIQNSGGRVSNVFKSDDFADSRMILTNVISFKGAWTTQFNKSDTKVEPFYNEKKQLAGEVNMMYLSSPIPYSNIEDLKAFVIELPYGSDEKYSMLVMLPQPDVTINQMSKNLDKVSLKDIFKKMEDDINEFGLEDVEVKIPRFQISTNVVMNKPLYYMGVYDIFEPGSADFSKATSENIYVSAIVHKAEIEVTETGTVASASSSSYFANRITTPSFIANRPFVYLVLEKSSATVIISGIYSKPALY